MRAPALLRQVLSGSVMAWMAVSVLSPILMWTLDVGLLAAMSRACFVVAVLLFGAGAASISGGVTWVRPLGPSDTGWKPVVRGRTPALEGPLTLLGVALFVVPQLMVFGGLLYD